MNRSIRNAIVAGGLGIALAAGTSAAAFADTPTPTPAPSATAKAPRTLADLQKAGATATSKRIASLDKATDAVKKDTTLSDDHRSTILGTFSKDRDAMTKLATTIAADTDAATAEKDVKSIYSDYRVYTVALRQAHDAAAADRITGKTVPALDTAHDRLSKLADSKKAGSDVTDKLAEMAKLADSAKSAVAHVASDALAVTPASYDADHTALDASKKSIESARDDIKKAAADGKDAAKALHTSSKGSSTKKSSSTSTPTPAAS